MSKTAIMTDSSCGISRKEAAEMGISVIYVPVFLEDELFFEEISLTQEEFYRRLTPELKVKTSQPNIGDVKDMFDKLLEDNDEVLYIPQTSGISSTYESGCMLAEEYGGKVQVVNNYRVGCSMRQSIEDALFLREKGYDAAAMKEILERDALPWIGYMAVDTLDYIKKGGRISPAAAAIATVLNIKPVLILGTGVLEAFTKVRGKKLAKKAMLDAVQKDLDEKFAEAYKDGRMRFFASYTGNPDEAAEWIEEIKAAFPGQELGVEPFPLNIASHIGPGALAIYCVKRLTEADL